MGTYGEFSERVRRRQRMSVAAELAWNLLPPLTCGTDRLVISGVVAPVYELGGDSFVKTLQGETGLSQGIGEAVVIREEMLEPADQILFFTDGVIEARSADGECLGVERLVDMSLGHPHRRLRPPR